MIKVFIAGLFLVALIFRLWLSGFGNHPDLISNASWGKHIYDHGTHRFYDNVIWDYQWPDEPPLLILMVSGVRWAYLVPLKVAHFTDYYLFPSFLSNSLPGWKSWLNWFGENSFYPQTFIPNGYLVCLKLIGILADLGIAFVLLKFFKANLWIVGGFLFLPASWYLSGLWGQYDSLAALILISSFLFLSRRHFINSMWLMTIGLGIKPQLIFFIPFYLAYFYLKQPKLKSVLISLAIGIGITMGSVLPFSQANPLTYASQVIYSRVFSDYRFRASDHAFNLWSLIDPASVTGETAILGMSGGVLALIILVIFNIWVIWLLIKNPQKMVLCLYLIAAGSFLFMTGMHERYFYPAWVLLTVLVTADKRLVKWWLIVSVVFSFNLFYSWGYPWLDQSQVWTNTVLVRLLSFLQIVLFAVCLNQLTLRYKIRRGVLNVTN